MNNNNNNNKKKKKKKKKKNKNKNNNNNNNNNKNNNNKKKTKNRPNQTLKKYLEWNILESGGIINVRKDIKASCICGYIEKLNNCDERLVG